MHSLSRVLQRPVLQRPVQPANNSAKLAKCSRVSKREKSNKAEAKQWWNVKAKEKVATTQVTAAAMCSSHTSTTVSRIQRVIPKTSLTLDPTEFGF